MPVVDLWTRPDPASPRKRVPTSRHGTGKRWAARWRDPSGVERSRSFAVRDAAAAYLAQMTVDMGAGTYADPRRARATVGHYATRWLDARAHLRPSTLAWYRVGLRTHVLPRWEHVPVAAVTRAAVTEWVAALVASGLSPSRARGMFTILRGILEHAVDDRAVTANPAAGARLPAAGHAPVVPLTAAELARLHDALPAGPGQHHRLVLLVLAFAGIRWGELVALDVGDLDGRRLAVDDAVTEVAGVKYHGPTKTHAARAAVLPSLVADRLAEVARGRPRTAPLLPAPRGERWSHTTWRRALLRAAEVAGLPPTKTHALRHTAASLAIASGADVKVLQRMLGHATASMTLDTYGHLMPDRLETVADALEAHVPGAAPPGERRLRAV